MRLLNPITLGFAPLPSRVGYRDHSVTLVAKALLKMQHGAPCRILAPKEPVFPSATIPMVMTRKDEPAPVTRPTTRRAKPGGDALLVGHFHAPGGRPVRLSEAGLTVGNRTLRVAVLGRRTWSLGKRRPGHEAALPFTKLEMRWEHAFGGPGTDANPVGQGSSEGEPQALDLPQIERLDRPFAAPNQCPDPIGHPYTNPRVDALGLAGFAYNAKAERRAWALAMSLLDEVFQEGPEVGPLGPT